MKTVSIGEWQNNLKRKTDAARKNYERQINQVRGSITLGFSIVWLGACSSIVVYMCVRAFILGMQ